ncbi:MAG TPA: four helix bundle protein [Gemmataceae bacterium]|jgi:four helix bundle protein|nr:four helix bundle protein [Gemmataceae bacterium]
MSEEGEEQAKRFNLEERLLDYATAVIGLTDGMKGTTAGRHLASQLLRSATSPLGSHGEAQSAESTKDFIHKLSMALKELRESFRWLKLIGRVRLHDDANEVGHLLDETGQLIRIFNASIHTAQKRLPQKP